MANPPVLSPMKASNFSHCRGQLIYYMGKVVDNSPSSLGPLNKIVKSPEFKGLLELLSGVGTQNMIKLLESASRNCAAKKAEIAESNRAKKRADAVNDIPDGTKRARLHGPSSSSDRAQVTTHDESRYSEPLLPHLEQCNIQRISEPGLIPGSLPNCNQTRRQRPRLSGGEMGHNAEADDAMTIDSGSATASLRLSDQSSHGDDGSRMRVNVEYDDSASESREKCGEFREVSGQLEDEQICVRRKPQSAKEHGGKTAMSGSGYPSEASSAIEKALQSEAWDMYNKEVGIVRRDPNVIAPIEDHCCETLNDSSDCRSEILKKEVGELLNAIEHLDFLYAKDQLLNCLCNRRARMGIQPETPATWTMSEPQNVLGALLTIGTKCDDLQTHRAFAQMKLCLLVQQKLKSGYKSISSGKGSPRKPEMKYLKELARREAGPVSNDKVEAKFQGYRSEYKAGKRWLKVADWFGGPGIVLVFITAGTSGLDHKDSMLLLTRFRSIGIGPYHVAAGWKKFHRRCLEYISQSLYSIRGLVGALGTDCLEIYCQYGQLPQKYINKVIEYEGIIPAEEMDEDDSEMDETEEAFSGAEVHDGKEEESSIKTSDSVEGPAKSEDTSGG